MDYNFEKSFKPNRRLGQCFLRNRAIAVLESEYGRGKRVVEIGPGFGILTKELCSVAQSVVSIEKDSKVYNLVAPTMRFENLTLLNRDFFDVEYEKLKDPQILISNIPYNISSRVIEWLSMHNIPAILCMQKEFVQHMMATPNSGHYSRLSVISNLAFKIEKLADVPRGDFYPIPNVDSIVINISPKRKRISPDEHRIITLLMSHSSKRLRNSLSDSHAQIGRSKAELRSLADSMEEGDLRPCEMEPNAILEVSKRILKAIPKT